MDIHKQVTKIIILIFLSATCLFKLAAQIPNNEWAKQFGRGGTFLGEPKSIVTDATGNIYVTGSFSGTNDFDPGPGTYNLTTTGGADIFIMKLNASGNLIWVKQIGGTFADDIANSIVLDVAGNLLVTGYFYGSVDFDPGMAVFPLMAPNNFSDVFVLKLNKDGEFIWVKQVGGNSTDGSTSMTIDKSNNIYVSGTFWETADFDPGASVFNLTSISTADIFILKLNNDGEFLWAKQFGGNNAAIQVRSLKNDIDGNVIATGFFSGTCDFNPGAAFYYLAANAGYSGFVLKLNEAGNFSWAKAFIGNSNIFPRSLSLDSKNNIYTTGSFEGVADFDPASNIFNLTASNENGFISKLDSAGNFVFAKRMTDRSYCLTLDRIDNIYVGGVATEGYSITKFTNSADSLWRVSFGKEVSACNSISVDSIGNIYTTGLFKGITDFDPGPGEYNLTPVLDNEIFVHKLNQLIPTPVSLLSFSGVATINGNQLKWATSAETENSYFEIERSKDGSTFFSIIKITGAGNSVMVSYYNYLDKTQLSEKNYYRLRQVNTDGKFSYSKVILISKFGKQGTNIVITPNPSSGVVLIRTNHLMVNASVKLISEAGATLLAITNVNGNNFTVNISKQPPGVYFLEINEKENKSVSRIVKY